MAFLRLCRRLPINWKIDMVVRRTDWVCTSKLRARRGFTRSALSALRSRMANEQYGPTVARQLESPGFLGLHYDIRTPISVLIAHAIFGVILGVFYIVK
jgi:hypothetical protein